MTNSAATGFAFVVPAGTTPGPATLTVASGCGTASNADLTISAPLPVELLAFMATRQEAGVALAWRTASEKNSASFEVERSADGYAFAKIGEQTAQGTKSSPTDYAFLDDKLTASPVHQLTYYRLRQVDHDGTFAFSPVRAVPLGAGSPAKLLVWPNPTSNGAATATTLPAGTTVQVLDALGRLVATAVADTTGAAHLQHLRSGLYVVRSGTQTARLVVH